MKIRGMDIKRSSGMIEAFNLGFDIWWRFHDSVHIV
jgi:hypothetical protein